MENHVVGVRILNFVLKSRFEGGGGVHCILLAQDRNKLCVAETTAENFRLQYNTYIYLILILNIIYLIYLI
jgi:hypothetical protein